MAKVPQSRAHWGAGHRHCLSWWSKMNDLETLSLLITCPASRTQGREDRLPRASIWTEQHPGLWTHILSRYQPG